MDDDDDLSDVEDEGEAKKKETKGYKSNSNKASPKSKKQKTLKGETVSESKLKSNNVGTKSATTAKGMKSNDQLLSVISNQISCDDAWKEGKPLPYSALCDVFAAIEAISSRLEIQEKLTELFRLVLLRDRGGDNEDSMKTKNGDKKQKAVGRPDQQSDLYSLIYLASNSVAPSYECVELGVGDSILIKAIGEASGTAPNMIKKKYDIEGDLGTVAQTSKGKQKTLVGFGRLAGPKRLEAKEVLTVFRQIATTSGSQSQKWKVDKIKGLLVRARGSEPKYIIRGLQGKLRIGLAQSTVLASLAHAVVLTKPKEVVQLTNERLKEIREMEDGDRGMLFHKFLNAITPIVFAFIISFA
jgi:DNA ligase-1